MSTQNKLPKQTDTCFRPKAKTCSNVICYEMQGVHTRFFQNIRTPSYYILFEQKDRNASSPTIHLHLTGRQHRPTKTKVFSTIFKSKSKKKQKKSSINHILRNNLSVDCLKSLNPGTHALEIDVLLNDILPIDLKQLTESPESIVTNEAAIRGFVVLNATSRRLFLPASDDLITKMSTKPIVHTFQTFGRTFIDLHALNFKLNTLRIYKNENVSLFDVWYNIQECKQIIEMLVRDMQPNNWRNKIEEIMNVTKRIRKYKETVSMNGPVVEVVLEDDYEKILSTIRLSIMKTFGNEAEEAIMRYLRNETSENELRRLLHENEMKTNENNMVAISETKETDTIMRYLRNEISENELKWLLYGNEMKTNEKDKIMTYLRNRSSENELKRSLYENEMKTHGKDAIVLSEINENDTIMIEIHENETVMTSEINETDTITMSEINENDTITISEINENDVEKISKTNESKTILETNEIVIKVSTHTVFMVMSSETNENDTKTMLDTNEIVTKASNNESRVEMSDLQEAFCENLPEKLGDEKNTQNIKKEKFLQGEYNVSTSDVLEKTEKIIPETSVEEKPETLKIKAIFDYFNTLSADSIPIKHAPPCIKLQESDSGVDIKTENLPEKPKYNQFGIETIQKPKKRFGNDSNEFLLYPTLPETTENPTKHNETEFHIPIKRFKQNVESENKKTDLTTRSTPNFSNDFKNKLTNEAFIREKYKNKPDQIEIFPKETVSSIIGYKPVTETQSNRFVKTVSSNKSWVSVVRTDSGIKHSKKPSLKNIKKNNTNQKKTLREDNRKRIKNHINETKNVVNKTSSLRDKACISEGGSIGMNACKDEKPKKYCRNRPLTKSHVSRMERPKRCHIFEQNKPKTEQRKPKILETPIENDPGSTKSLQSVNDSENWILTDLLKCRKSVEKLISNYAMPVVNEHKMESMKRPFTIPKEALRKIYDHSIVETGLSFSQAIEEFKVKKIQDVDAEESGDVDLGVESNVMKPKLDIYIDLGEIDMGDIILPTITNTGSIFRQSQPTETPLEAAMPLQTTESTELRKLFKTTLPNIETTLKTVTIPVTTVTKQTKSTNTKIQSKEKPKQSIALVDVKDTIQKTKTIFNNLSTMQFGVDHVPKPFKILKDTKSTQKNPQKDNSCNSSVSNISAFGDSARKEWNTDVHLIEELNRLKQEMKLSEKKRNTELSSKLDIQNCLYVTRDNIAQIKKKELMNKIQNNLKLYSGKIVELTDKYVPYLDRTFEKGKVTYVDGKSQTNEGDLDVHPNSKLLMTKSLQYSMMVLKKLHEASRAFETRPKQPKGKNVAKTEVKLVNFNATKPHAKKSVVDKIVIPLKHKPKQVEASNFLKIKPVAETKRNYHIHRPFTHKNQHVNTIKSKPVVVPQIKTIVPTNDVSSLKFSPIRSLRMNDNLSRLTVDSLPPIQAEYPRRDHYTYRTVENTFLFKLVYGNYDSNNLMKVEPSIICNDCDCTMCNHEEEQTSQRKKPLNCELGKKNIGKPFNFRKYWDNLGLKHKIYNGPNEMIVCPVNVNYNNKRRSSMVEKRSAMAKKSPSPVRSCGGSASVGKTVAAKFQQQSLKSTANKNPKPRKNVVNNQVKQVKQTKTNPTEVLFRKKYGNVVQTDSHSESGKVSNGKELQKYIEVVEEKFLRTFSLPEREKITAYKVLEQEIRAMLDLLSNNTSDLDITKSFEEILQRGENVEVSKNMRILRDLKQMLSVGEATKPAVELCLKKKTTESIPQPTKLTDLNAVPNPKYTNESTSFDPLKKSKSESIEKHKRKQCVSSKSDASNSSEDDYDTIYEETASDSSDDSNLVQNGYKNVPLRMSTAESGKDVQSLVNEYNSLQAEEITNDNCDIATISLSISSIISIGSTFASDTTLNKDSTTEASLKTNQTTGTPRMMEFLDVITSLTFDKLTSNIQHSTVHYFVDKYCVSRLKHIVRKYRTVDKYFNLGFANINEGLTTVTKELALLTDSARRRRGYRLMSFKDPRLRKYTSLPEFDLTDDMFLRKVCRISGAKSLENLEKKHVETLCQTMILNLQLLNQKPLKGGIVGASVRSLQRRRKQRTKLLTQVVRKKRIGAVTTVMEKWKSSRRKRKYKIFLIVLYFVVFVTVFCSLILNYKCI